MILASRQSNASNLNVLCRRGIQVVMLTPPSLASSPGLLRCEFSLSCVLLQFEACPSRRPICHSIRRLF